VDGLWRLVAEGAVDVISSDHSPAPPDMKRGDLLSAWGGIAGCQSRPGVVLAEGLRRGVALERLTHAMAAAPAQLLGLPAKGRIAPGADADLVLVDTEHEWTLRADELRYRHPGGPFVGMAHRGAVRGVLLRGRAVAPDGAPHGDLLRRAPADPRSAV